MKELDAIKHALAALDPSVKKPWVKLDKMLPYIHATDDPGAKPYSTPVVGRFDYMPSADYILSCNPAAMQAVIDHIDEQAVEIERLRRALQGMTRTEPCGCGCDGDRVILLKPSRYYFIAKEALKGEKS